MDLEISSNNCTPSTTWGWRKVKISRAPQAESDSTSGASSLRSLLPWPTRRPLTLRVTYRGGPECWWEIKGRDRTVRRPGTICLHDILREFYGGSIR